MYLDVGCVQYLSIIINFQHSVHAFKEYTKYFYKLGKNDAIEIQKLSKTTEMSVFKF